MAKEKDGKRKFKWWKLPLMLVLLVILVAGG